jgi:AcrR family transcriptional regulator
VSRWNNSLQTSIEIQKLKRDAVLREAGRAFSERGYHSTSLDDVAKALGVSKGTLYNYVKDKQEILWEFHRLAAEIAEASFASARVQGGSGAEMLRNTLRHFIHGLTQELGACRVLMEFNALRPADRVKAAKLRDSFEKAYVDLIEIGIADGSLRAVEPKLAIFTFMGAINWIPRWYSPTGRLTSDYIAETMTDILLQGLVTQPAALSAVRKKPARRKSAA